MKIFNRCDLFFLLICVQVSMLCAQSISTLYPQVKSKIDPLLQQAIIQKEQHPDRPIMSIESHTAGTRLSSTYGDVVAVLIKSDEDINKYTSSVDGMRIGSRHGNIYTAFVPVQSVSRLAQLTTVKYIEASRWLYPSLDLSRPKTGADVLQALPDLTKRLTGKGVIVGFTDSGINTDHPNFKLPDGRTRILYVWDQYGSGTPPSGFTYGVEKDSSAINAHTWSMPDYDEHGTHVSGIVAGNGMPSMQYIGMAPEADIIMVANQGDDLWNHGLTTVGTLDGYDYIRTKANALHKRFVINTSQGTNLGPHDGTTLFEQAVNTDAGAGSINCISAGNEATSSRHASAVVTTSSPGVIQCGLAEDLGVEIPMDIWYETNDRLVLRIKETVDPSYVSLFPPVDSTITYSLSSVDVTVTTRIGSPLNGDNEIYITFYQKTPSCSLDLQFSAQSGNILPDGGRIDLWWERNYSVSFTTHVDQSITLGMPACADSAITVASYNNRAGYGSVDDISSFSARGPRRDGVMKPEITGLGGMVISSVGSSGYAIFSGTSMSSPHVTGAVALLLQQDSTLKNYQIRQKLFAAATADGFTGSVPNPTWGYGKLNVLKATGYHGIPIIDICKDTIQYIYPYVGIKTDDSVMIRNLGNEDLTISNISVSDPIYSVDKTSLVIPPRSQEKLIISVTPTSVGSFSGSVTVTCDDTTHPTSIITVLGYSDYPPSITVVPDSFDVTLASGDSLTTTMTIGNTGISSLNWSINLLAPTGPENRVLEVVDEMKQRAIRPSSQVCQTAMITSSHRVTDQNWTPEKAVNTLWSPKLALGGMDIAIIHTEEPDWVGDVRSKLLQTGQFNSITLIDGMSITPTLEQLQAFKSVLVFSDFPWSDRTTLGNVLAAYIEGGGGVVCGLFATAGWSGSDPGGNFSQYQLITFGGCTMSTGSLGTVYLPSHPLMQGVTTFAAGTYGLRPVNTTIVSGAVKVADWDDGKPLIVYKDNVGPSNARRVDLGFFPVSDSVLSGLWISTTDGAKIMANALIYAGAGESFVSVTPTSGVVAPGATQTVDVKFNAKNLVGGDYRQIISISNNDPIRNPKEVPANLHVIGRPAITVVPDTVKTGVVYVGTTHTDTVKVENIGSDVLNVTDIISSIPVFAPSITNFSVLPGAEQIVTVSFTPTDSIPYNGILTIMSNDSLHPTVGVILQGQGLFPPIITVVPDSFMVTLASGDSLTKTMTIGNIGRSALNWSTTFGSPVTNAKSNMVGQMKEFHLPTPQMAYEINPDIHSSVGKTIRISGKEGILSSNPDFVSSLSSLAGIKVMFDYAHSSYDGDTLSFSTFLSDLRARGATINVNTAVFTSFLLSNYNIIIITEGTGSYTTDELSALQGWVNNGGGLLLEGDQFTGSIPGHIATYGIQYTGTSGTAGYTRNIISHPVTSGCDTIYVSAPLNTLSTNGSAQTVVFDVANAPHIAVSQYGSGRIVVVADDDFFGSVIQGADNRTLANKAADWLAGGGSFWSVTPSTGTIAPGGLQYVDVKFSAKNLMGGYYRQIISISSNDPVHNPKNIPANLHVIGKPAIVVIPDTVKAGTVFIGSTQVDTMIVKNIGSDVLNVMNITSSLAVFTTNVTNFSVLPGKEQVVAVRFSPTDTVVYNGTLSVTSNDSTHATVEVILQGHGASPPVITAAPDSFAVTLVAGDSTTTTLTIGNIGLGALTFSLKNIVGSYQNSASISFLLLQNSQVVQTSQPVPIAKNIPASMPSSSLKLTLEEIMQLRVSSNAQSQTIKASVLDSYGSDYATATWDNLNANWTNFGQSSIIIDYVSLNKDNITYADLVSSAADVLIISDAWDSGRGWEFSDAEWAAIKQYVEEGHGLIATSGSLGTSYAPNNPSHLTPLLGLDSTISYAWSMTAQNLNFVQYPHPLLNGMSQPYQPAELYTAYPAQSVNWSRALRGAQLIAISPDSSTCIIAYRNRVYISNIPEESSVHDDYQLLYNAIVWASTGSCEWLSENPTSGTLASSTTQDVTVKFNAKGLLSGDYRANISIASNDPLNGTKTIPAHLTVTKKPDLVSDGMMAIPKEFALRQNYPNPFNPSTTIKFDVPKSTHVTLSVYNILGALVTTLVDEDCSAGSYTVQWNGQARNGSVASGIYFTVIRAGDFRKTVKMILMK